MNALHPFLAAAPAVIVALAPVPAAAQQWQGTWVTRFGEFRLFQNGDHVFGEYRDGTIEGIIDARTGRLRARFRNPDGTTGYAELMILPDNQMFAGAYKWENEPLPTYEDRAPDRRWAGRRTASTAPTTTRVSRTGNRAAFINGSPAKYREWIGANTASAAASTAAAPPTANPLSERFAVLKDYPANFRPRFFEVRLDTWSFERIGFGDEGGIVRSALIYGTMGLYAYCETAQGTRALVPFGNAPNRVFDSPRDRPVALNVETHLDVNKTTRRFSIDQTCLRDPDARISVQIQTNLNEKNHIEARDNKFGFRSIKFYLDQIPNNSASRERFS